MAALLPRVTPSAADAARASVAKLLLAGCLLLALAGTSYVLSFVALGSLALPLALGIAACKALTVLFAFMEFGQISASAKLAAGAALLMLILMVALMVADVATREAAPHAPPRAFRSAQDGPGVVQ